MSNNSTRTIMHCEGVSIGAWSAFGVHNNPSSGGSQSNPTIPAQRLLTWISSHIGTSTPSQGTRGNRSSPFPPY